jgi:hypothetical protein
LERETKHVKGANFGVKISILKLHVIIFTYAIVLQIFGFPKISRKTLLMWVTGTCNLRTVSKEGMADVFKDFGRLWDYWDHPSFEFMGCFPFR